LKDGERCQAIVRPEKLAVNAESHEAGVTGILESSVYLGTATQLTARMPDGASLTALVPNVDEDARQRLPAPGQEIRLSWAPEHMHIVKEEGP
jgi:ABC-type Fe3+/spermidine/putrescine transport system ATPase subunit